MGVYCFWHWTQRRATFSFLLHVSHTRWDEQPLSGFQTAKLTTFLILTLPRVSTSLWLRTAFLVLLSWTRFLHGPAITSFVESPISLEQGSCIQLRWNQDERAQKVWVAVSVAHKQESASEPPEGLLKLPERARRPELLRHRGRGGASECVSYKWRCSPENHRP